MAQQASTTIRAAWYESFAISRDGGHATIMISHGRPMPSDGQSPGSMLAFFDMDTYSLTFAPQMAATAAMTAHTRQHDDWRGCNVVDVAGLRRDLVARGFEVGDITVDRNPGEGW